MERVAFLIESTGERLGCMLNPQTLLVRRQAGVRARRSMNGALTGSGLSDDPLLYTGGGTTEMMLDLLFDVTLPGSSIVAEDVRQITAPLWNLAENDEDGNRPPLVRFVWGKNWNIPSIVSSIAERLEYFNADGAPRRSWIRLRLLRAAEPTVACSEIEGEPIPADLLVPEDEFPEEELRIHEVRSGGEEDEETSGSGDRLDLIAHLYYGDARLWRALASFNDIDDPSDFEPGQVLRIPPASAVRRIS